MYNVMYMQIVTLVSVSPGSSSLHAAVICAGHCFLVSLELVDSAIMWHFAYVPCYYSGKCSHAFGLR